MKGEFRRVLVNFPSFSQRGNWRRRLGIVLNQTFVKRHIDARLGLAVRDRRIEGFRLGARDITHDVVAGRVRLAKEGRVARRSGTTRTYEAQGKNQSCGNVRPIPGQKSDLP